MNKLMLALTVFVLSTAAPATAAECATSDAIEASGYYIAIDDPTTGAISAWIYEESNGQAGLQRDFAGGDEIGGDPDCASPDTIII